MPFLYFLESSLNSSFAQASVIFPSGHEKRSLNKRNLRMPVNEKEIERRTETALSAIKAAYGTSDDDLELACSFPTIKKNWMCHTGKNI